MKILKLLVPLALIATACVSPPLYDSAIAHEGLSVGAGFAYQSAYRSGTEVNQGTAEGTFNGARPDFLIAYGVSNTFSIQGRFGMFVSPDLYWRGDDPDDESGAYHLPVPMSCVGLKLSTPAEKRFNTALRMDLDFPNIVSLTPMMGLSDERGHEFITMGLQTTYLFLPQTAFINVHPVKGLHVYAAADVLPCKLEVADLRFDGDDFFQSFCLGLAYTHHFGKREQ